MKAQPIQEHPPNVKARAPAAADGMKQLARVSEREYLFTNNPLITSDGQRDQTSAATQELALNETGRRRKANSLCCRKDFRREKRR